MDQSKIGKFIATCRKEQQLTQMQLAEKLGITDKAVSKWELGIAMPDSSIMLELCGILGISVNELLSGEKINMEEQSLKTEALLLELTKKEEKRRKTLFVNAWVMAIIFTVYYVGICVLAYFAFRESPFIGTAVVIAALILDFVAVFFAATMELEAGRYVCRACQHEFEETRRLAIFSLGYGTPKNWKVRLKCPKCHKKTWTKRVLPK